MDVRIDVIVTASKIIWFRGYTKFHNALKSLFLSVVELEYSQAEDTMPRGVSGLHLQVCRVSD